MNGGLRIAEVARRTGVTIPTLRAWERRYGVLTPDRSAGGHRRYDDADVDRVRRVQRLVRGGWSLAAAAQAVRDTAADEPHRGPAHADAAPGPTDAWPAAAAGSSNGSAAEPADLALAALTLTALRRIVRARSPAEVVQVLLEIVVQLGGEVVPAAGSDRRALPLDVSLGEREPLLPAAEPMSVARMHLELVLPPLVEDARRVVHLLRLR